MLSHNLTVKGFVNEEFGADPAVTLTITSIITLEELEGILEPIRKAFNTMGDSLSFNITFQELDL
jgi:hypothetical protein|tara:strand:+ start:278 stop:472 length:195 start_codon:yes stop_codon:yes gene_type:complete